MQNTNFRSIIVVPGRITRIIHNEPEKMNAMTIDFEREFPIALQQAREDPDVRVVTLTATGTYFCAGDDMKSIAKIVGHKLPFYENDWRQYIDFHRYQYFYPLWDFPKPIVCGVQGGATGGGAELAALCDITVTAENSIFGYGIERWGVAGFNVLIYTCGWKKAAEIYLTGWNFNAQDALRLGLATKVVPPDKVEEEVMRYANILALVPSESLYLQKLAIRFALNAMGARQTMFYGWECAIMAQSAKSAQDAGEALARYSARYGMKAALEKSDEPFIKYGYKRLSPKGGKEFDYVI